MVGITVGMNTGICMLAICPCVVVNNRESRSVGGEHDSSSISADDGWSNTCMEWEHKRAKHHPLRVRKAKTTHARTHTHTHRERERERPTEEGRTPSTSRMRR